MTQCESNQPHEPHLGWRHNWLTDEDERVQCEGVKEYTLGEPVSYETYVADVDKTSESLRLWYKAGERKLTDVRMSYDANNQEHQIDFLDQFGFAMKSILLTKGELVMLTLQDLKKANQLAEELMNNEKF